MLCIEFGKSLTKTFVYCLYMNEISDSFPVVHSSVLTALCSMFEVLTLYLVYPIDTFCRKHTKVVTNFYTQAIPITLYT